MPADHAPEVLLAHDQRVGALLVLEQGPDLISGGVTMDNAMFATLLPLSDRVSPTSRFNHISLLDIVTPIAHPPSSLVSNGRYWRGRCILRPIYEAQIMECSWLSTAAWHKPTDPNDRPVCP